MTNWKTELQKAMKQHGESFADIISNTLVEGELLREFDPDYGGIEGVSFTAWTEMRVYFPVQYDGSEWVSSVARHPDGKPTHHIGG